MKYLPIMLLFVAISCKKSGQSLPPEPPKITAKDTFNFLSLTVSDGIGFSDSSFYSQLSFEHDTQLPFAGRPGDTTFAKYYGGGNFVIHYLGPDSLLLADSIKSLNSYGVNYRLSKSVLGKPLFAVYSIYSYDTTTLAIYTAASDSVMVYVSSGLYPNDATPQTITNAYNSLLYQKLDKTGFFIN